MQPAYPPLPDELVEFTRGGKSLLVGTASAARVPDCVRAVGIRIWPGASQLTVLIPAATGARSVANLRETGKIAITLSHIPTHRTVQLKGSVLAVRDGDDADREHATRYRIAFAADLAWAGQSEARTLRLGIWPCVAVDVEIAVAFAQTPGPVAGKQLPQAGHP